jgi:ArsR family transcriptional regulator
MCRSSHGARAANLVERWDRLTSSRVQLAGEIGGATADKLKSSIGNLKNAAARAPSSPVVPDELLERAAARFALLSDPTRLRLVSALHLQGEGSVGELAASAGISVANASQHLNRLAAGGVVGRRRDGTSVRYRIVDDSIEQLCHLVCEALAEDPR